MTIRAGRLALLLTVILSWPIATLAQSTDSDQVKPVLVELFTSEGCSSCPPADALLSRLSAEQPIPGVHIIALGEHVDYWNRLGWVDRFASAQFTQRQRWYARERFGSGRIYTPQMVVDGSREFVGSYAREARDAIVAAAQASKLPVELDVTRPSRVEAAVDIRVSALPDGNDGGANLWLAVTQNDLQTQVRRGENAGATLEHAAVVRRMAQIGHMPTESAQGFSRRMTVPLDANWPDRPLHVVVFVQEGGTQRVIGAAERRLPGH